MIKNLPSSDVAAEMSLLSAALQDGRSTAEAQRKVRELKDRYRIGVDAMAYSDGLDAELIARLNARERDSLDIQHAVLKARVVDQLFFFQLMTRDS